MSPRWLVAIAVFAACGDDTLDGPYDALPLDGDFTVGVSKPVHVARDRYGVAHINAQSVADAAFVQGYVMAHDRLPQMDILRRFGAGTLSELFGALDPTVIDTDLEMRMHRMKPLAAEAWTRLQASTDDVDQQVVVLLQRFSDGVNAYAQAIKTDARPEGVWTLDPNLLVSFDPDRFTPWDPVDSLVLGRFQAFALSWSTPFELDATELFDGLRATFVAGASDPAAAERAGISADLMTVTPVGQEYTIADFPNVTVDRGTRSDGTDAPDATPSSDARVARRGEVSRPTVPPAVFAAARTFFARGIHTGPFGALGPHAFMHPHAGSNNWAIGPALSTSGQAILATDQHLQLPNPSIFYPTHLVIRPNPDDASQQPLDLLGITFPGIPGVILGTNGKVAWSATVSEHDVNDVFLETIGPCTGDASRSCAQFEGDERPLETFTETVQIGALGTILDTKTVTYEVVPHHGPIIPAIDRTNHVLVPRTAGPAMSVAYTGYVPTFEIRALWNLGHASTVQEGFNALKDFSFGSQNWTMIDASSDIGWTTNAVVPLRDPRAYTWNARTNPTGLAPFLVLPGDGTAEWTKDASGAVIPLSSRYVPHARTRHSDATAAYDYLVTANADPVGATGDNDPLNGIIVDGRPLYVGVSYAAGVRAERIATLIREAGPSSIDETVMAAIQHDTRSTMGAKLAPYLGAILQRLDTPGPTPTDFADYVTTLPAGDHARLVQARTLLAGWTFATPTGLRTGDSATDSAATALFNTWMHFFIEATLKDELARLPNGFDVWRLGDNFLARIIYALLSAPQTLVLSADTGQPILCDVLDASVSDDSCDKVVLQTLVQAMLHLESASGFNSADPRKWRWGDKHRLKITPLFPNTALDLPGPGQPGFPKTGDNFCVNRSDQGWSDLDFAQYADGPAQRFIAIAQGVGVPIMVRWALPGGVIFDSRSAHYRDLLDDYYLPETHFDAPYVRDDIVRSGESRWVFR